MSRVTIVYSEGYYADLQGHVFPIEKYRLVAEKLLADGCVTEQDLIAPEPASREDLLLVHTPAYLDDLFRLARTHRTIRSEMALTEEILRAFVLAAGGSILAAEEAVRLGAAVNLGGGLHHAFPDHAEGFCYINDIAVGIRKAMATGIIQSALVVDCDLHQGNGTAVIFADDPRVTTFSIHQENNYPLKERSDLDIGLPDFAGDELYLAELRRALDELVNRGEYDLVFYVAGSDPFAGDILGGLSLTLAGLRQRDRTVFQTFRRLEAPVAVVLAGGYASRREDTVAIHSATVEELLAAFGGDSPA